MSVNAEKYFFLDFHIGVFVSAVVLRVPARRSFMRRRVSQRVYSGVLVWGFVAVGSEG
jgi:hypothetical protein